MNRPVLAIVGPTGVGKSNVAQTVALQLKGAILSADSMQVYRCMDIGTAKISENERVVPHFGLDLVDPGESYSAAQYQTYARHVIRDCAEHEVVPIVCGGTGLYVSAALDDLAFDAQVNLDEVRNKWIAFYNEQGSEVLYQSLIERDPESARLIHPNNIKRVLRALEMYELGTPYSQHASGFKKRCYIYPALTIGLTMDRAVLYDRINKRVERMIEDGLVDEVKWLLDQGFRSAVTASQAIGYKELVGVIEGTKPLSVAVSEVQQATRRYAKRQLTWFRGDKRVLWIDATHATCEELTTKIVDSYTEFAQQ